MRKVVAVSLASEKGQDTCYCVNLGILLPLHTSYGSY